MATSFHDQLMQLNQIGDVQSWLTNKFGDGTESWSDKVSILSQLNKDVLRDIRNVFHTLHINVKLKFLLYILHIPRRLLDENKHEIDAIVSDSLSSPDPWVNEIANLVKNFRNDGSISFDSPKFCELVSDIKKIVKKQGDKGILPYEAMFMNKTAFQTTFGQLPPIEKHFTLQKRAKSASLRQELLQKANDLVNGKRSNVGGTAAIRCRGVNFSSPMKGLPSRSLYEKRSQFGSSFGGFGTKSSLDRQNSMNKFSRYATGLAGKREGGIVLLDTFEAPPIDVRKRKLNAKEAKAEAKKAAKEQENATVSDSKTKEDNQTTMASEAAAAVDSISPAVVAHKSSTPNDNEQKEPEKRLPLLPASLESVVSQTATKSTPDYAAGLISNPSNRFTNDPKSNPHQSTLSSLLTAPPVSETGQHSYLSSQQSSKSDSNSNSQPQQQQQSQYSQNNNSQPAPVAVKARNNMYSRYQGQKNSTPAAQTSVSNQNNENNSKPYESFTNFGQRNQSNSNNEQSRGQLQTTQHLQPQQQPPTSNIYQPLMGLQNSQTTQSQSSQMQTNQQNPRQTMQQPQQQPQLQPAHQPLHPNSHLSHPQRPLHAHSNTIRASNPISSTSQVGSSMLSPNIGTYTQNSQPLLAPQQQRLLQPQHQQQVIGSHLMPPNGIRQPHQILQQQQSQQPSQQQQFLYGVPISHSEQEQQQQQQQQRHTAHLNPYGLIRIMNEANANDLTNEIWSKSNYLCNDERNLILNFLKGTLDNPIPNCGNSAMLKYYEQIEVTQIAATAPSVSVHIEMYFLMNFDTREWKKFRSVKPVARDLQINNDRNINKIRFILPPPAEQMSNNWHLFESGIGMPLQIERPPAYSIPSAGMGPNYRTLGNSH